MNAVLQAMLASGTVTRADGSTVPLHSAINRDEGETLQRLIRKYKPRTTLEIGLAYGVSALFICEALTEVGGSKHVTIDPLQQGWENLGLLNLNRAGYGHLIEHHNEPSHRALPELDAAGCRVDFAFIDGWHTLDYVMVDFFYVDRLLNVGGILALDDAWSYPAVRKVARYIATNRQYAAVDSATPSVTSPSRWLFEHLTSPLRAGALRGVTKKLFRADVIQPDSQLHLPQSDVIAFVKTGEDVLGDGSGSSRGWDQHRDF